MVLGMCGREAGSRAGVCLHAGELDNALSEVIGGREVRLVQHIYVREKIQCN